MLFAIFASTAYMVHSMSFLYLIWLAADQLYLRLIKKGKINWELVKYTLFFLIILILPWFIWAVVKFGPQRVLIPTYTISEIKLSIGKYLFSRLTMMLTTFLVPVQLSGIFAGEGNLVWSSGFISHFGNPLLRTYLETFFGGFTFLAIPFFAFALIRQKKISSSEIKLFFVLVFLGALTCLGFHILIDHKGLAFNIMGPLVLLFFIFLCSQAADFPKKVQILMFILMFLEFAFIKILMFQVTFAGKNKFPFLFDRIYLAYPNARPFILVTILLIGSGYVFLMAEALSKKLDE